jgi:hypothetical protein
LIEFDQMTKAEFDDWARAVVRENEPPPPKPRKWYQVAAEWLFEEVRL